MLFRTISKDELPALVRGFAEEHEVIGPIRRGGVTVFDEVGSRPEALCVDYTSTVLPPKKELFPPKETLFSFDTVDNSTTDVPIQAVPRVLFGLHPCDIAAISQMDRVFLDGGYRDPYYAAQRDATMIVGLSCMPDENCFCNVWGTGEVSSGYDLFLHDIGERYLVTILSVRAAEILANSTDAQDASEHDNELYRERLHERAKAFAPAPCTDGLAMNMDACFSDDSFWQSVGGECLSCGACANVCPNCHCFDMCDVLSVDGKEGRRERVWDSCTSPSFSTVTGGHNFRPTPASRVRDRFYHKFVGFPSRYGEVMCTGCGRCVSACKVHIDPRAVLQALQSVGKNEETAK